MYMYLREEKRAFASPKYSVASFQLLHNLGTNLQMKNLHSDVQGCQTIPVDGRLYTNSSQVTLLCW